MAEFNENQNGVWGGVEVNEENKVAENTSYFETDNQQQTNASNVFGNFGMSNGNDYGETNQEPQFQPIEKEKAITEKGLWSRVKAFLFQEIDLYAPIKVELTPYQQKVEDEINEFLHQEITFKGIASWFTGKK